MTFYIQVKRSFLIQTLKSYYENGIVEKIKAMTRKLTCLHVCRECGRIVFDNFTLTDIKSIFINT